MQPNITNPWFYDQSGSAPLMFSASVQTPAIPCFPVSTHPTDGSSAHDPTMLENLIQSTRLLHDNIVKTAQHTSDLMKQQGVNWKNPALYKTSICKNWKNTGLCKYGDQCWYAHGKDDVRYVPRLDLLPSYLDSLQSFQAELAQKSPSVEEVPLDYFKNVPPPSLSSMPAQQATLVDSGIDPSHSTASTDFKNVPDVGLAPVMLAPVMASNPVGTYWYSEYNGPVASAQANFGSSSSIPYCYGGPIPLNFDDTEDPSEAESHIEKENHHPVNIGEFTDGENSGRIMFAKSFHMFGQSYPLHRNWA